MNCGGTFYRWTILSHALSFFSFFILATFACRCQGNSTVNLVTFSFVGSFPFFSIIVQAFDPVSLLSLVQGLILRQPLVQDLPLYQLDALFEHALTHQMTPPSPPCFSKDVAKLGPMPSFAFTYLNLSCSCLHYTPELLRGIMDFRRLHSLLPAQK